MKIIFYIIYNGGYGISGREGGSMTAVAGIEFVPANE
jgi:hypothetical protein